MHGAAMIKQSDLVNALTLARQLFGQLSEIDRNSIQCQLGKLIKLVAGVPTGTGSGRSGLQYKAHATLHAQRLVTKSWSAACQMLNATFTNTGDMGTEASFAGYTDTAWRLMGDWVREEPEFDFDAVLDIEPEIGDDGQDDEAHGNMEDDTEFAFDQDIGVGVDSGILEDIRSEGHAFSDGHTTPDGQPSEHDTDSDSNCGPDLAVPEDKLAIDLRPMIFIAGCLHILHNCMKACDMCWGIGMSLLRWTKVCRGCSQKRGPRSKKHSSN